MNKKQSIGLCSLLLTSVIANAGVSGTVYKDIPLNGTQLNTYGTHDTNENGVAGITVTASPSGETTTTAADGTWSLNTTGKTRVEFTDIPSYLKESKAQSSVQFIDGEASTVDLALFNPSEYTNSPENDIAMTTQANSSLTANTANALSILRQTPTGDNDTVPSNTKTIAFNKLGTVWGLAYDSTNKDLYASAALRRHGAVGTDGLGAIYKIAEDDTISTFVTITDVGTVTPNRNLSDDTSKPSHDPVFDEVGRVGLGDIDISEDGKKLYVINITTNNLVVIDIATKTQNAIGIGNPFASGCNADDVKSWGIGQKDGEVYVGSVCTTDTAQGAYISKLTGSSFEAFHQVPLDMDGESSLYSGFTATAENTNDGKRWRNWIINSTDLFEPALSTDATKGMRKSTPAPILSDIMFDENQNMVLGFIDRTGMQAGVNNYSPDVNDNKTYKYDSAGDIYKVCKTADGYANEGSADCPYTDATGKEFFLEEEWTRSENTSLGHKEIALGGLAYLQGSKTVLSSAFDPAMTTNNNYDTSGIIWMNTTDGKKTAGQVMVGTNGDSTYNGKAGGIGDIEILTPAAPTEIGNKVWFDENANCIQDANETGISGVEINLYASSDCTGSATGTTTTDENGRYLFTVDAGTDYSVCINGIAGQTPLDGKKLTCNTAGTALNNSDATVAGEDAKIALAALTAGANDHSLDFGFTTKDAPIVIPVIPTPVENNRTVDHTDGTCDCHSYEESTPALSVWSMMLLISLTSFMAFLFRKELNQVIK